MFRKHTLTKEYVYDNLPSDKLISTSYQNPVDSKRRQLGHIPHVAMGMDLYEWVNYGFTGRCTVAYGDVDCHSGTAAMGASHKRPAYVYPVPMTVFSKSYGAAGGEESGD